MVSFYYYNFLFQINKNDCESNPCQNDGECIDDIGKFYCNCTGTGYYGLLCQHNENECKKNPNICMNDGVCYDTYGSYVCECLSNYSGFNCEQLIDPCSPQPCGHGGSCISRKNSFECLCSHGYSGEYCEKGPNCPNECSENTKCIAGQCCESDSTGKQCTHQSSGNCDCFNGGVCNDNSSICICPGGFDGVACENDIDECEKTPNICVHGICVNQPGTFKCYCEPGKFFSALVIDITIILNYTDEQ